MILYVKNIKANVKKKKNYSINFFLEFVANIN